MTNGWTKIPRYNTYGEGLDRVGVQYLWSPDTRAG